MPASPIANVTHATRVSPALVYMTRMRIPSSCNTLLKSRPCKCITIQSPDINSINLDMFLFFPIRQVFPNALSTRVPVGNHTVYMMAGLRKKKAPANPVLGENVLMKSQVTTSVTNRTAATVASAAGLTLLAAAATRGGTLPISTPKLNTPGLSPAIKGNFSAQSPLAIVNKASSGLDQLNSTVRTLSPLAVPTGQSPPPSHVTATTLIDHSSSNSTLRNRILHSHSLTMTTITPQDGSTSPQKSVASSVPPQNAKAMSTPPQNARAISTPPQNARAASMPPQNAKAGYAPSQTTTATSLHHGRSVSTPPQTIRTASAPLLLASRDASDTHSSVCSLSGRSSPNLSASQALTRIPSPTSSTSSLSLTSAQPSSLSLPSAQPSSLSLPSAQPSSVANSPSVQPQESSRPSTPALSISSSCDLESSYSLSAINLQSHSRDGYVVFKEGTSIRSSTPSRSESPVTVSTGEGKQQAGQVKEEDSGNTPSVQQLGGGGGAKMMLQNGETQTRCQVPENGHLQEPVPKRLKLDATVAWDSVDLGLQPVNSERTHFGILQSPLVQRTTTADEIRSESPGTLVETTIRHVSAIRTDSFTASGSLTGRNGLAVCSSGATNSPTSYSTVVSSTASTLIATANSRTNVTTNLSLQEPYLTATDKSSLTCSSGSWTRTTATVMDAASSAGHGAAAHAPSLMTSSSSIGSDTGNDSNRSMDVEGSSVSSETLSHPLSTEVGGTRCGCSWDNCNRYISWWSFCRIFAASGHPSIISVSQSANRITVGVLVTRCCTCMHECRMWMQYSTRNTQAQYASYSWTCTSMHHLVLCW